MAKKFNHRNQGKLFQPVVDSGAWKPSENLPDLSRHKEVWIDCTATGNDKRKDRAVAMAVTTLEGSTFIPWGFEEGGNLDRDKVMRWAKNELRGKRVGNLNTGFDAEVMRNEGIDLEELGCTLHDVAHAAALLNENRYGGFNLDDLGHEYVGRGKVDCDVKPEDHHRVHSSLIAEYEMGDSELARDIDLAERPLLEAEDLGRVMDLEDRLIWANNHMERTGMRLDLPKLRGWREEMRQDYADLMLDIWSESGVKLGPNKTKDWGRLFDKRGLERNKTGEMVYPKNKPLCCGYEAESYTDEFLGQIEDPVVRKGLRMRRLSSLLSKYVDKYLKAQRDGTLYFNLYQLRAGEEDRGTVVGRYSSANVNIQQVFKPTNQYGKFCDCGCPRHMQEDAANHKADCLGIHYIIREVMIPADGYDMFAVDGSQLQFRLFAHYSNDPMLINAYNNNPDIDFHRLVANLFDLERQAAKHNNFAMVLGMGREKLANRLGLSCDCQHPSWWARPMAGGKRSREHIFGINSNHAGKCPARKANTLADKYEEQFPAAKNTMQVIMNLAEHRGWIKTLLGRRRRYQEGDRFYSAFAGLLQGSEADVVKSKILTLYDNRKTIGIGCLRAPVHDEVVGDIEKDPRAKERFREACAESEISLKVPMIWNAEYGPNWKACH